MLDKYAERRREVAVGVARLLDGGWRVVDGGPEDARAIIEREDGARVWFGSVWNQKDRITVSGGWPKMLDGSQGSARSWGVILYGAKEPGITVGAEREVRDIVRDIERRFLPEYLPLYARCLELRAAGQARLDRQAVAAATIAQAFGAEIVEDAFRGGELRMMGADRCGVRVDRFRDDRCTVTLELRAEDAASFVAWLDSRKGVDGD